MVWEYQKADDRVRYRGAKASEGISVIDEDRGNWKDSRYVAR